MITFIVIKLIKIKHLFKLQTLVYIDSHRRSALYNILCNYKILLMFVVNPSNTVY